MHVLAPAKALDDPPQAYDGADSDSQQLVDTGVGASALHDLVVEIATDRVHDATFQSIWRSLVAAGESPQKIYQTPELFEALRELYPEDRIEVLSLVRLSEAAIVGVVPVRITRHGLHFNIGPLKLFSVSVKVVIVLGSCPAVPPDAAVMEYLSTRILSLFPSARALFMHALPRQSRHWSSIEQFNGQRDLAACRIGPWRACHTMPLPPTFNSYMDQFSTKKRYNLNRQLRLLGEQAGALALVRIERPDQVDELMTALAGLTTAVKRAALVRNTACTSLARRSLLQCYVLRAGGEALAVIIGTRTREVLHIHNIFTIKQHAALSVGTTALQLVVRDAIDGGLGCIDFGYGTPNSEFRSSHVKQDRATVLLFDRMTSISLLFYLHTVFVDATEALIGALKWARKKVARRVASLA